MTTSGRVSFSPDQLRQLFGGELGDVFLFVASPGARATVALDPSTDVEVRELHWDGPQSRSALLAELASGRSAGRRTSVLWIADDEFEHYQPEELEDAKLVAISSFSAPLTLQSLAKSVEIVTTGDYDHELEIEAQFLDLLDEAETIRFVCPEFGTSAVFRHQEADHWFSLHGPLDWGQQTVLPTGELSALVNASGDFVEEDSFAVDGQIVLRGQPVVHRGSHEMSLEATKEMYGKLSAMADHPAVLDLENGFITAVNAPGGGTNPFVDALRALFADDARYAKIHELGFGTNVTCRPLVRDNFFANERFPGVHLGIGLGGYTPFHVDMVTDAVEVKMVMPTGDEVDLFSHLGLRPAAAMA